MEHPTDAGQRKGAPMGRRPLRARLIVAAGLLGGFWLGGWGLGGILARRGPEPGLNGPQLAAACQQALSDRLSSGQPVQYAKSFFIKEFGDRRYRLVSHFDQDGGRTRFACDA